MELKVSLDNITITAYIKSHKLLSLKKLVESHAAITIQTAMTDMFRAYTKAGGQVVLHIDYDKIKGQAFNARPFRLEFNPNKLRSVDTEIIDTIIPYLDDISISRADLAFDLFEVDCSEFVLEKKGRPTATKEFRSDTGKLETKYLGASRSEKQVRLYNKKKEQLENGTDKDKEFASQFNHWWRLEFQLRSRSVEEIFEVINTVVFKPFKFEGLPVETQIYLVALTRDKSIWKLLHRNTRTKYKKILETYQTSDIDYLGLMKDLLKHERPRLENQLAYYGGRIDKNSFQPFC
ncbi:replication initiation protein [Streptococcus suis]|uniref:replication initiation protein n=1 Tax=Streptococcus suis TaxID=1307 RepID=UPI000CF72654|nr:replication initiation protein [Streptococcus suis]MBM0272617.1 replication initiation protein [Streptococcus suis]MCK3906479.1 replication initiation factor domain-containing protein [Streptococcus suis]MCL4897870.1 replication initiation factor domain-containing protein [Streptococcus suis]NQM26209.1 replication initiation protein [Streptococcus suis]NRH15304.1 replication initiation protein [Streptococcus suis]